MTFILAKNTSDAWTMAKAKIFWCGERVITERREMTKEYQNLMITIQNPLEGFPIPGSGWEMKALDIYAEQFNDPDKHGFDYSYGERLNREHQIRYIIDALKKHPTSRKAIATTWLPKIDQRTEHGPCLQLIELLIRNDKLNMTAVFRSHDIGRAYVSNVYGLGKLQERIAKEVGVKPGSLTTVSISAHIYEV